MSQCHLTPGLAGLFLDLVPMIKDFAQDLVGQRALGAETAEIYSWNFEPVLK